MYAGKIVEVGDVNDVYGIGVPYTIGLLRSIPCIDAHSGARLAS